MLKSAQHPEDLRHEGGFTLKESRNTRGEDLSKVLSYNDIDGFREKLPKILLCLRQVIANKKRKVRFAPLMQIQPSANSTPFLNNRNAYLWTGEAVLAQAIGSSREGCATSHPNAKHQKHQLRSKNSGAGLQPTAQSHPTTESSMVQTLGFSLVRSHATNGSSGSRQIAALHRLKRSIAGHGRRTSSSVGELVERNIRISQENTRLIWPAHGRPTHLWVSLNFSKPFK